MNFVRPQRVCKGFDIMTIPIKGHSTFDELKHCWIGSGFKFEWFKEFTSDTKILDPLERIANETEEDLDRLETILKSVGVITHRSYLDIGKYGNSLKDVWKIPMTPRDHHAVIGNKFYEVGSRQKGFETVLDNISHDHKVIEHRDDDFSVNTACLVRLGKDLFWDINEQQTRAANKYIQSFKEQGYRVHVSNRNYHSDGAFCLVRPGCIISLNDVQDYQKEFPGWEVLYLPDQSWSKLSPFLNVKDKVKGRWWIKGEEDNDKLIKFVNTWLSDWVGYVEETVFDVNMLSINPNLVVCNNHNKQVFDFLKKHKVEPLVFNFRHRYFWDGGVHCITQDLYREGTMEDYLA